MNRHTLFSLPAFLLSSIIFCSCGDDDYKYTPSDNRGQDIETVSADIQAADQFAIDALETYYLWIDENGMLDKVRNNLNPKTCTNPVGAVDKIRSSEDRWTKMYEDVSVLKNDLEGIELTNGQCVQYGTINGGDQYFLLVCYVYEGSPAEKAGIKRGDVYVTYNGMPITDSNLMDAINGSNQGSYGLAHVEMLNDQPMIVEDDKEVTLSSVTMYENPVLSTEVFTVAEKKVGYLAYANFDLESCAKLIDVCKKFKAEGISELILDLRYNGGGYVATEELLASMLAPKSNVEAGDIYEKEVYNAKLTKAWGNSSTSFFKTKHAYKNSNGNEVQLSTANANIGIDKIYALVSGATASASESLIVGLKPYVDIEIIGTNTHGKFCTGVVLSPADIYKKPSSLIEAWGIYVMMGSYSDKNGNNPCRPNGLKPDIEIYDTPYDGCTTLGDPEETMLKAALDIASGTTTRASSTNGRLETYHVGNVMFGKRILKDFPKLKE